MTLRRPLVLICCTLPATAFGNPIVLSGTPFGQVETRFWVYVVLLVGGFALSVEYLYLRIALRKIPRWQLLKRFGSTNAISFPVTTLVSGFFGIVAELIPLLFEPWFFDRKRSLTGYPAGKVRLHIILANLTSFLAGVACLYALSAYQGFRHWLM